MYIQIFSMMAAIAGRDQVIWDGDVPDRMLPEDPSDPDVLPALFRYFNRVDECDEERLDRWHYHLPSLSAGDYICFGGKTWQVQGVGFKQISQH